MRTVRPYWSARATAVAMPASAASVDTTLSARCIAHPLKLGTLGHLEYYSSICWSSRYNMAMGYIVDTHCHIHDDEFNFDVDSVFNEAKIAEVGQLICIGTSAEDSQKAVDFAKKYNGVWASVGLHPHDAKLGEDDFEILARLIGENTVVAVGECGLDYYYDNSPRNDQIKALEYQLQLAVSSNKPCIFHVREAFADFWGVLKNFPDVKGVIHSFSESIENAKIAVENGLFVGLNGIISFKNSEDLRTVARQIPIGSIVLETDAPFLTPTPLRGTINVPANVRLVAACLAEVRGESLAQLIEATTSNAHALFGLDPSQII